MGLVLARLSQTAIERAANESGLFFTTEQVRAIAETEASCLAECRRVSFGEGSAVRIVREFASSPFVPKGEAGQVLAELVEGFYELRDEFPASVTDEQIIESLRESFDGETAGDAGYAAELARASVTMLQEREAYTIVDESGKVYRGDSEDWRENVFADGWCGERWEDIDA